MNAPDLTEALRTLMQKLAPYRYQEIRESYYKAIEGLRTLREATEMADSSTPLLDEHIYAITALELMKHSQLGKVV